MPITIAKEVIPYEEHLYCDKCRVEMKMQDAVLLSNPIQFVYVCPECGRKYTSTESWPKIAYKEEVSKKTFEKFVD